MYRDIQTFSSNQFNSFFLNVINLRGLAFIQVLKRNVAMFPSVKRRSLGVFFQSSLSVFVF